MAGHGRQAGRPWQACCEQVRKDQLHVEHWRGGAEIELPGFNAGVAETPTDWSWLAWPFLLTHKLLQDSSREICTESLAKGSAANQDIIRNKAHCRVGCCSMATCDVIDDTSRPIAGLDVAPWRPVLFIGLHAPLWQAVP